MSKITLDEFLNKNAEDLVDDLTLKPVVDYKFIKEQMKGFFKHNPQHMKFGTVCGVGKYHVLLTRTVQTTKRVFFRIDGEDREFSLPMDYLLDMEQEFPYKVGDQVAYENDIWEVIGIVKSSNKVKLSLENGSKKTVPVGRVTRYSDDNSL